MVHGINMPKTEVISVIFEWINRLVLALDELLLTDLCVGEILGMLHNCNGRLHRQCYINEFSSCEPSSFGPIIGQTPFVINISL
jgi:hypothetical protein